jgi:prophage DNA circulation protein
MAEVFEQYEVASWWVGSVKVKFPVTSIQESGGNRIVERNRPYRDGAKLDDVGSNATRWTVEAIFENSINEPGVNGGNSTAFGTTPLYPEVLNQVIETFRTHATGDLGLPTRGTVRARAESYTRTESESERDCAKLSMVFVEDNEDNVDAQKFQQKTAQGSAKQLTESAVFDAQSEGAWNTSLADLREFGSELEGIANYPSSTRQDLDSQASIVVSTVNSVERTAQDGERKNGYDALTDPETSRTQRKLEETRDLAGRSRLNPRVGRRRLVPLLIDAGTDLFTLAANLGQDVADLLDVNPSLDPNFIPAGTVLRVFEKV